mgnify:CR=1 FL=1
MVKVGINGFGRIGRLILRALLENYKGKIQVVGINDLGSIEANAHLIKFDSTHGTLNHEVKTTKDGFQIGDQNIKVFAERDPSKLPWGKIGADVVLECTGFFLDKASAGKHIQAGAKKVIISAPAKEVDFTLVQGVNSKELKKEHNIISNGSCTTNCLAPVAMVLEKNFGITMSNRGGFMENAVHSVPSLKQSLKTPCYYPSYTFFIDYNGDVLMCSHDWGKKNILGNLNKEKIIDVWLSNNAMKSRKNLYKGNREFSPCNVCDAGGSLIGKKHVEAWKKF